MTSPETRGERVGSSERAAEHFGGKDDFGIPAEQAQPGQQTVTDGSLADRPLGTAMAPADPDGRRDVGVGAPDSGPGSFSGGDLDPDIIGIGTGSGVAASGPDRTQGPDIVERATDSFATGGPAKGKNQRRRGSHGAEERPRGTVHDRGDRQVHMGESARDDTLPASGVDGTRGIVADSDVDSGFGRSTGEDADDREASTGAD